MIESFFSCLEEFAPILFLIVILRIIFNDNTFMFVNSAVATISGVASIVTNAFFLGKRILACRIQIATVVVTPRAVSSHDLNRFYNDFCWKDYFDTHYCSYHSRQFGHSNN